MHWVQCLKKQHKLFAVAVGYTDRFILSCSNHHFITFYPEVNQWEVISVIDLSDLIYSSVVSEVNASFITFLLNNFIEYHGTALKVIERNNTGNSLYRDRTPEDLQKPAYISSNQFQNILSPNTGNFIRFKQNELTVSAQELLT